MKTTKTDSSQATRTTIKHHVVFEHCEKDPVIQKVFDRYRAKLEKHSARFRAGSVFLHGCIERHPTKQRVRATLVLNVPNRTLVAKEDGAKGEIVVREAFEELERQLKKYNSLLRGESVWKRKARREPVRQRLKLGSTALEEPIHAVAWENITPYLEEMYNFVRRELAYYWANGDLQHPDEISVEDLLDRILLRAVREWARKSNQMNARVWLFKIALEEVQADIQRVKYERELLPHHIEEDVPEVPPDEELKTLGDWIYEFYQPDEDLRLEDLVADPQAISPEEVVENRDLQRFVNHTLARLPKSWREAFMLHDVEGLTIPEVAHVLGQNRRDVEESLANAREFLRRTVEEELPATSFETSHIWASSSEPSKA